MRSPVEAYKIMPSVKKNRKEIFSLLHKTLGHPMKLPGRRFRTETGKGFFTQCMQLRYGAQCQRTAAASDGLKRVLDSFIKGGEGV